MPLRSLALVAFALTLLFGLVAGPLAYASTDAVPGPMAGCQHERVAMAMDTASHAGHTGDQHDKNGCSMPAGCCVGSSCVTGGLLPATVSPSPLFAAATMTATGTTFLRGISVSPLLDPPRRSG